MTTLTLSPTLNLTLQWAAVAAIAIAAVVIVYRRKHRHSDNQCGSGCSSGDCSGCSGCPGRKPGRNRHLTAILPLLIALASCHTTSIVTTPSPGKHPTASPSSKSETLPPDTRSKIAREARSWIGTPYSYGGHSTNGTDCSGLVMEVYRKVCGINLPRSSREQQAYCAKIKRDNIDIGDLLFFTTSKSADTVSHVGLYVGDGKMVHASSKGVVESNINDSYFTRTYHSSGRVIPTAKPAETPKPAEAPQQQLDKAINEKIDSIYSSYFD